MRSSHAANDGRIFAWDNPPPTGHPGEDYGCRCTAEPYFPQIDEFLQLAFFGVSDSGRKWASRAFVDHYFNGNGRGITLRSTGHLRAVVEAYRQIIVDDIKRLPSQIAGVARQQKHGAFSDDFVNTYDMQAIVFSLGDTTIGGEFSGHATEHNGIITVNGNIDFYLSDEFADPLDLGIEFRDGDIYPITDTWSGRFRGRIYHDKSKSQYIPRVR